MKHILNTIAATAICLSAMAQTDVQPYKPGVTTEGITYCLPRTALRVVVTSTRTDYTPGELQPYAQRYMSLNSISAEPSTTWTLDKIEVQPYGVPDPSKFYSIALKSKTIAPLVSLADDGRILSVNKQATEPAMPAVPKSVEGKNTLNPSEFLTRDMQNAGSRPKKAELVAQEIYDIRDSRTALSRGEADNTPKDGAQLQLMFNMLQKQEEALMSLFTGTTVKSTVVKVIDVVPEASGRDILLRFSTKLGVLDTDDYAGAPVFITIEPQGDLPEPTENADAAKKKAKAAEKSIRYNVPARTNIKIGSLTKQYTEIETPMGQFGHVEILGEALLGKNVTTTATFHPATGGLLELTGNVE